MTERLFTLNDVTTVLGPALAQAKAQHGGNPDRALDLFCQGVIDGLKALDTTKVLEAHVARAVATGESWIRVSETATELVDPREDFASPND